METFDTIFKRRSIRKFTGEKIPPDILEKILRAAMAAPSAGNGQPWHFIVIDDPAILEKIAAANPYAAMAKPAGLAIMVCGDVDSGKFSGYWMVDCSAAVQNLLLAVTDLGLGAVWTGIYPREERLKQYREILTLPENIMPLALIPVGYPAEDPGREDRFKPERIHRNKW